MSLLAGERLGPYEILGLIGSGGMGEVYRARDTRLAREVAIKVSDAQFTERFSREAQLIASWFELPGDGTCGGPNARGSSGADAARRGYTSRAADRRSRGGCA
jgi:hypothetical protein